MADMNLGIDDADSAALARLLDPVALEARLAEARIRRAGVLAAREAPPEEPILDNLPGLALRGAGVILAGLTVVATIASLLFARPGAAPEAVEMAAVLTSPAAISPPPAAAAPAWQEASLLPPLLAGLPAAFGPIARPFADEVPATATAEAAPAPSEPVRVAAVSRARSAEAPAFAEAAAVLRRTNAAALLPMMSRSAEHARFPLVQNDANDATVRSVRRAAPKQVRQPGGLVGQIARIGRAVVRDVTRDVQRTQAGDGVVRSVRRASAILNDTARAGARQGIVKSTRDHRSGSFKANAGPKEKGSRGGAAARGKGPGKAAADRGPGKGGSKSRGGGRGKGGGKGHRR